jgi:hypothetical protein
MTLPKLRIEIFSILVLLASFATAAEARKVQMVVATFSQSLLPMVVAAADQPRFSPGVFLLV